MLLSIVLLLALGAAAPVTPPPNPAPVQGGLMVAPTRLVFEGRVRSSELTLVNNGTVATTYRIAFVQMRLTETGGMEEVPETEGVTTAAQLVRYSPRQVRLLPKAPQVVRLQLRKPADLPPGEYRSHLVFRAVPEPTAAPASTETPTGVSVKLVALYGVAIPVFVRQGETSATAALSKLGMRQADDAQWLDFTITRDGNRSVYGNLTATFVAAGGRETVVGQMNGVAVYAPTAQRRVALKLRPPPGLLIRGGRVHLTYTGAEASERTRPVLATADLALP